VPEPCARQDVIAGAALRKRLRLIEVTSLDCLRGSREPIARSWALLHRRAQRTERTAHTLGLGLRCARQDVIDLIAPVGGADEARHCRNASTAAVDHEGTSRSDKN
jgi:hypothetical protein